MYVFTVFSSTSVSAAYWMDLFETTNTVPGTWEWGDGTPLAYPNTDPWLPGEPGQATSDHAALSKADTLLYDTVLTSSRHFICEK